MNELRASDGTVVATTTGDGDGMVPTIDWTPPDPVAAPLDVAGQMAALLAAKGLITEDEAAGVTGHPPERLVAEVEAWAAAEERTAKR